MKGANFKSCLKLVAVSFALLFGGCITLPNSPISPTPKFYMLSAVNGEQVSKRMDLSHGVIIGIGPVKIPEYLDRPQMVTKDKEGVLKFDEFDRWGESLDQGIARLVREDLTVMLPGTKLTLYPWNPILTVRYQVQLEIVQLDSILDNDIFLALQWSVIDLLNSKTVIIKRSEFRTANNPQNYSGLAKTLSVDCASLSAEIAESLGKLQIKSPAKS